MPHAASTAAPVLTQGLAPDRPLRVAVVSKATAAGGGASRVAQELAALLRAAGHRADHWAGFYSGPPQPHIRQLHGPASRPLLRFFVRRAHRLTQRLGLQELLPVEFPVLARELGGYDLVHFHDISSAASPLTVALTARRAPTVWTYHDCSPFTGGCIQPLGCQRFHAGRPPGTGCRGCPQRGHWPLTGLFEGSGPLYALKARLAESRRREPALGWKAVAPSAWMAGMALASGLEPGPVEVLPNGVDCQLFQRREEPLRRKIRAELGLPETGPVVLLCSGSLADRFKGIGHGLAALERLARNCPEDAPAILIIGGGAGDEAVRQRLAGLRHAHVGYLHDQRRLAELFGACDLLLYPTLADNLPLVVLEALASGLAVAAFATGGVPEMVTDGMNGRTCAPGDEDGLARCLADLLAPGAAERMGAASRRAALERFSHEAFLAGHLDCYARLLAERPGRAR